MGRDYTVYVTDSKGNQVAILPDDDIPSWAEEQLHERHFQGSDGAVPPQTGRGSGVKAWQSYAEANGVDVDPDATKDEIIAACEAAGVATE